MYTREEVVGMVAGRELDALVAEHVMGYEIENGIARYDGTEMPFQVWLKNGRANNPKSYSTEIAAAFKVVEKLQPNGIYIDIRTCLDFYEVQALEHGIFTGEGPTDHRTETIADPSVAVGICKAALLSLLKED